MPLSHQIHPPRAEDKNLAELCKWAYVALRRCIDSMKQPGMLVLAGESLSNPEPLAYPTAPNLPRPP
ncbi:hypothetical protein SCLCIDRAFT_1213685 [Scleroderma citrinum Foug A]|uniref:Uncharacterized protein n=1 Tax=Scleroderma citrinum Foug A TaxID=1036808 RepID=A0A0C2ZQP3_9AGAM|nr:hypothetical protein SCLCIDRAFT_1213685 [Scleroderma citrinum Foug A]